MPDKGDFKMNDRQCLCDGVFLEKKHEYRFGIGGETQLKVDYLSGLCALVITA